MKYFILSLFLVLTSSTCYAKVGITRVIRRSAPVIAYQLSKVNVQTNTSNNLQISRINKQQILQAELQAKMASQRITVATSQLLIPDSCLLNQQKTMKEIVRERRGVIQKKTRFK